MNSRDKIELLSPAKNSDVGIEAIYHGADAVYIGGPKFGARAAAGNSVADIERLAKVAHTYYARVYVALNTILSDAELADAEKLIRQLYNVGVDALIVQDMGITQLDLPPISLHASTQVDNRTAQKVSFLQEAGFDQVVLARELSLDEIRDISSQTTVRLEAFVHGALCVSYSGQCYLSHALCGRSANRGACAQFCRLPYSLVDSDNKVVVADKHLLSLKDMNQSDNLLSLIQAGVSSLKIEGRLKDVDYVKNVTAYYRQKLDDILGKDNAYSRSSSGKSSFFFVPSLEKSFNRSFTTYFYDGRQQIASFDTPKSQGEPIGLVSKVGPNWLVVDSQKQLSNGDGFCFFDSKSGFVGFKANRVEDNKIFPLSMPRISVGTMLNRNQDAAFDKLLSKPSAERRLSVDVTIVNNSSKGFVVSMVDEDGNRVERCFDYEAEVANNEQKAKDTISQQLSKLGNTPFVCHNVKLEMDRAYFIPSSFLNEWRRLVVSDLLELREKNRRKEDRIFIQSSHPFVTDTVDFRANVYNSKAADFYAMHGVKNIDSAFECNKIDDEVELMRCRHCIRYSLGFCSKLGKNGLKEPLFLENQQGTRLRLKFDCKNCEMVVLGKRK